jgi:hypothetical protein
MAKNWLSLLYIMAMVLTVVVTDIAFFKNHTGPRLAVNIGIILLYAAFYWRFFKK